MSNPYRDLGLPPPREPMFMEVALLKAKEKHMKRGQLYAPGGYLLDCMDCDKQVKFSDDEYKSHCKQLWDRGWVYFRGWFCPECAKENGLTNEKIKVEP